jgi:hypothetical protein
MMVIAVKVDTFLSVQLEFFAYRAAKYMCRMRSKRIEASINTDGECMGLWVAKLEGL